MAGHDKDMEDQVKRISEELKREATLAVLMELIISLAFKVKDAPDRKMVLTRTIAAIRNAWAKEN